MPTPHKNPPLETGFQRIIVLTIILVSLFAALRMMINSEAPAQASTHPRPQNIVPTSANSPLPHLNSTWITKTYPVSGTRWGESEARSNPSSSTYLPLILKSDFISPQNPVVIRLIYANGLNTPAEAQANLNRLAAWLDIWEVDPQTQTLIALVWPDEYNALIMAGYSLQIDLDRTGQIHALDTSCYASVEQLYATLAQTITTYYPDITALVDYGNSWEKEMPDGEAGYDLYALEITNQAVPGPKPVAVIDGGIHAREMTPPQVGLAFIDFLTSNYNHDPDVTWLVDYHKIVVPLMMNPDGRKHAELGELWRKNTDNDNGCSDPARWGTDLNRNFDFKWGCCGGSSGAPCSESYRGPAPLFEPEAGDYAAYVRKLIPDQWDYTDTFSTSAPITTSGILIDLHSYHPAILYPWGWTDSSAPNDSELKAIADKLATFNNYPVQRSLYPVDGTIRDWGYGDLGIPSFTVELGTELFQSCADLPGIIAANLPALFYTTRIARMPYRLIQGPDVLNLTLTVSATATSTAQLNATINDTQNGGQPIATAAYYIDTPPWLTTTNPISLSLTASDGAFDETIEAAQAELNLENLTPGRHTVFVHGQDADGNWGPFWAAWVTIAPAPQPDLTNSTKTAPLLVPPGQPFAYRLRLLNTGDRGTAHLYDPLSLELNYAGALTATSGLANWDGTGVTWSGTLIPSIPLTVSFYVTAPLACPLTLTNSVILTDSSGITYSLAASTQVDDPPTAGFTVPANILVDEAVAFSNTSQALTALNYNWSFGDGAASSHMHPFHIYTHPGTYTVVLTASTMCGSSIYSNRLMVESNAITPTHSTYLPIILKN